MYYTAERDAADVRPAKDCLYAKLVIRVFSRRAAGRSAPNGKGSSCCIAGPDFRIGLLLLLLWGVSLPANACCRAVLNGQVDNAMVQQVTEVIARGDEVVDLNSEWRNADGRLMSGGASQLGWFLGDMLRLAHVKVRCTGMCFSSAAHILIASRGCIVGQRGRIGLHVPELVMAKAGGSSLASARIDVIVRWRQRLASYDVPADIVDRALNGRNGWHELSAHEMKRVGCKLE